MQFRKLVRMAKRGRSSIARLLVASCFACTLPDVALAASEKEQVLAQALFDEARVLFQQGQYTTACAKFAESQRLDPKGGTLLNLAICNEKLGKTATAFTQFGQALVQARRDERPERVHFAEERLTVLRDRLSTLTVVVPQAARVTGLEIKLDGERLSPAAWDVSMPIDPGDHTLSVQAPGYRPIFERLAILDKADRRIFRLPPLASIQKPGTAPEPQREYVPEPVSAPPPSQSRKTWGLVVGGVGVGAVLTGAGFGIAAFAGRDRAEELGRAGRRAEAEEKNSTARTYSWISNAAFALGIVGLGTGAYLYFVPGSSSATKARRTSGSNVALYARSGGLTLEGSF